MPKDVHVLQEKRVAMRSGAGAWAVSARTTRNSESEAVGAADVPLASAFASASTASAKEMVKVGVPEFMLAARNAGPSTLARAPIRWSIVVVPESMLASISAGTSTTPMVLVAHARG